MIAVGRSDIVGDTAAVYTEMAQRAAEASTWVVANLLELEVAAHLEHMDQGQAIETLDQIREALSSAWAVLPGMVPPEINGLPNYISQLRDAIEVNGDVSPPATASMG